jgi:hypothetical protein
MRTPIGIKIRKVVDARMAWTRILLSYSGEGVVAIEPAARAGREGEARRWVVGKKKGRREAQGRKQSKGARN